MDWPNERYVRLYVRDTVTWKLMDWRARCVLVLMLRKVDRSGVLDVGDTGIDGLAAIIEMPAEVVGPGIEQLIARKVIATTATSYLMPNYMEAQESKQSDRARQRESRERRRADTMDASQPVTACHTEDLPCDTGPESVTAGHAVSQHVTPSLAEPSRAKEHSVSASPPTPADSRVMAISTVAVAAINQATGCKYQPDSEATLKLCKALAKAKLTPDQVASAVVRLAGSWRGTKAEPAIRPSTLLQLDRVRAALDDIAAGNTSSSPALGQTQGRFTPQFKD